MENALFYFFGAVIILTLIILVVRSIIPASPKYTVRIWDYDTKSYRTVGENLDRHDALMTAQVWSAKGFIIMVDIE